MFRKLLVGVLAASVVLFAGGAALAGGWAVTEFDEPLPAFIAGEEYVIGFTVLQHGETPRWTDPVHLTFQPPNGGPTIKFPAEPVGVEGHFEVVVVLPRAGVWQLEVDQGFLTDFPVHLEPHVVGPVDVGAAKEVAALVAPPPPLATPVGTSSSAAELSSGLSLGVGLTMAAAAFIAGALLAWMAPLPGTFRRRMVYKNAQPSPEAAWTTEN